MGFLPTTEYKLRLSPKGRALSVTYIRLIDLKAKINKLIGTPTKACTFLVGLAASSLLVFSN